jgi:tyrosine-protein kinase Etk/Wzc
MATNNTSTDTDKATPNPSVQPDNRCEQNNEEISLLDLMIVLAKRKRTIVSVTATFIVIAVILSLLLPSSYTASVLLLPPQQSSSTSSALLSQLASSGSMASLASSSLGIKNSNDMYVALLKSRTVEDATVQQYGLMQEYKNKYLSDARKSFEKHVTVNGSGKDGLIHISVEDRDPKRAAELANGYVDQYKKLTEHLAITEAAQRRLFYEQQLEQAKNKLADAEEALKIAEQTTGIFHVDSQAKALIESAALLRAQVAAKEVQIEAMRTYATGENSQLIQAQRELDGLRTQLAKLSGSNDTNSGDIIVSKGMIPEAGLVYARKLRDVKYYETIFQILAKQFELAKLDEAKEGAYIQVVDPATPPDRRSFPKRGLIVIGATALGFFVGIFSVLLIEAFERIKAENTETSIKIRTLRKAFSLPRRLRSSSTSGKNGS